MNLTKLAGILLAFFSATALGSTLSPINTFEDLEKVCTDGTFLEYWGYYGTYFRDILYQTDANVFRSCSIRNIFDKDEWAIISLSSPGTPLRLIMPYLNMMSGWDEVTIDHLQVALAKEKELNGGKLYFGWLPWYKMSPSVVEEACQLGIIDFPLKVPFKHAPSEELEQFLDSVEEGSTLWKYLYPLKSAHQTDAYLKVMQNALDNALKNEDTVEAFLVKLSLEKVKHNAQVESPSVDDFREYLLRQPDHAQYVMFLKMILNAPNILNEYALHDPQVLSMLFHLVSFDRSTFYSDKLQRRKEKFIWELVDNSRFIVVAAEIDNLLHSPIYPFIKKHLAKVPWKEEAYTIISGIQNYQELLQDLANEQSVIDCSRMKRSTLRRLLKHYENMVKYRIISDSNYYDILSSLIELMETKVAKNAEDVQLMLIMLSDGKSNNELILKNPLDDHLNRLESLNEISCGSKFIFEGIAKVPSFFENEIPFTYLVPAEAAKDVKIELKFNDIKMDPFDILDFHSKYKRTPPMNCEGITEDWSMERSLSVLASENDFNGILFREVLARIQDRKMSINELDLSQDTAAKNILHLVKILSNQGNGDVKQVFEVDEEARYLLLKDSNYAMTFLKILQGITPNAIKIIKELIEEKYLKVNVFAEYLYNLTTHPDEASTCRSTIIDYFYHLEGVEWLFNYSRSRNYDREKTAFWLFAGLDHAKVDPKIILDTFRYHKRALLSVSQRLLRMVPGMHPGLLYILKKLNSTNPLIWTTDLMNKDKKEESIIDDNTNYRLICINDDDETNPLIFKGSMIKMSGILRNICQDDDEESLIPIIFPRNLMEIVKTYLQSKLEGDESVHLDDLENLSNDDIMDLFNIINYLEIEN